MSRSAARGAVVVSLLLVSSVAFAQAGAASAGAPGAAAPPAAAPAEPAPDPSAPAEPPKKTTPAAGYAFRDTPAAGTGRRARAVKRTTGPVAMFPGFEQLPDGGTRVFVVLSQQVHVEERKAQGTLTYVLKGAHVQHRNNTNALVTVHFDTPVSRAKLVPAGADLHLVVELRAAAQPTWKLVDAQDKTSTLQIDFPKGDYLAGGEPKDEDTRPAKPGAKGASTKAAPAAPPASPAPSPPAAGPKP